MVTEILLAVLILLNVVLLVTVLLKDRGKYLIDNIEKNQNRTEGKIHDEFSRSRHEMNQSFKELREEIQRSVTNFADSILKRMTEISTLQNTQFENIRKTVEAKLRLLHIRKTPRGSFQTGG